MRALAALLLLLLAAPAAAEPTDRAVTLPDGRTLNLWCVGKRGPVVLFDSGWAADSRVWRRVMARLPADVRACAVDRPGEGRSSPGPAPRDAASTAQDYAAALRRGQVPAPLILVGHSLGALNMRALAALNPADVMGMVLVDPSIPQGAAAFAGPRARATACLKALRENSFPADQPQLNRCRSNDPAAAIARWESRLSELASISTSTAATLGAQQPGSLAFPLIVLTASRTMPTPEGTTLWASLHRNLATLSPKGEARLVESGHMMMHDAPDAIVKAIEDIRSR